VLAAVSSAGAQDLPGSQDHPIVSRYAGSVIVGYDSREFDELVLPLGRVTVAYPAFTPARQQTVSGKTTRILYVAPAERSTLEVMRNYELELKKGGFETLFSCSAAACGTQDSALVQLLFPQSRAQTMKGQDLQAILTMPQQPRYLAAKRASPRGDAYVSVFTAVDANPGVPRTVNRAVVLLEIVEAAPMATGLVTVNAAAMARALAESGHVALYGIYFDTNRAELKPESQAAIQEVASLLKGDPGLKLLVVGHTDNVGGYDANVALSERRANAVLQELTGKHGVAPGRLRAVGVGMAAPVAPNDADDGRAKNRRVELVKQ
jgi:outer membrane protein OmpA-like peptidoglycan-associated protein